MANKEIFGSKITLNNIILLIFIAFIILIIPCFGNDSKLQLTPGEKAWIDNSYTVRVRIGSAPPFMLTDGKIRGIAIDYLTSVFNRNGIKFSYVQESEVTWPQALKYIEQHDVVDMVPTAKITDERKKHMLFTNEYIVAPWVIFTRSDADFVSSIDDLKGKTVSVEEGFVIHDLLKRGYPEINLKVASAKLNNNFVEIPIKDLSTGLVDAYIGNLLMTTHMIQSKGYANIKVAAPTPFENHNQAMAIRNDWPELVSIINKTIATMTPEEHTAIRNRWLGVRYEYGISKTDVIKWILSIAGIASFFVGFVLIRNKRLKTKVTLKEKIEESLKQSENRLRTTLDATPFPVAVVDLQDDKIVYWSRSAQTLFGHTAPTTSEWYQIAYPDPDYRQNVIERWKPFLEKARESGQPVNTGEYRVTCSDGSERICELYTAFIPGNIIVTFNDITERKQAESELKEKEDIIKSASSFIAMADLDGRITYGNPAFMKAWGFDKSEDFIENAFKQYWTVSDQYDEIMETLQTQGEWFGEMEAIRKDGARFPVQVSAAMVFNSAGNPSGFMSTSTDITEQKRSVEILRKSEARYHDIFNNLMDVYFETTLDGTIENASPSAKTISGYSPAELTGKKVDILYHNPEDRYGLLAVLMQKGQARGYEILFKKKNGELYHTSINADLNYNKDGEPISLTGTIRDITESKQAEKEKILAQKVASKNEKLALVGQIAGKMAHDFNNILGIVMGNTELALLDCQEPKTKKTLELIYKQTMRGKNLTKNLVAFAKDQELKQEFFRISEKIELVINLMKKDLEGIELRKEESPGVSELLADPGMIEHALVNLIQNSIHALSMVEHPRITIRTYNRDNHICFEIEDNGCGISKENLADLYEPSFTLKGSKDVTGSYKAGIKGTGYGMSNVKKYIEQHKGTISIESEFGSGTKFTISLPIIKKELTKEEKKEIRTEKAHLEKYILLVEDEQAIADVQYRILTEEPCSHKVDIANNGKVAMDLFERNKYDLISLDYILPGDINGMDIYNHIRQSDKTIPILFISGNIEFLESIKNLMRNDPYVDHLSKPCKNISYLNCINKLFSRTI